MPVLKQYCNVLCMSLLWLAQWMHVRHLIRRVYSTTNWNLLVTWPQSRGTGHLPASALGLKGRWHLHYIYITNTMVVSTKKATPRWLRWDCYLALLITLFMYKHGPWGFYQLVTASIVAFTFPANTALVLYPCNIAFKIPIPPTPRLWFHTSIEQRLVLLKCSIYEHCRTLYNKQPAA